MDVTIGINPIPCPRPRIAVRGKFANAYYPASYKDWKEQTKDLLVQAFGGNTLGYRMSGPLRLTLAFRVRKPKSTKLRFPAPDVDNYAKAAMDAITAAGLWDDDKQVVTLLASKSWADAGSIGISIEEEP